MSLSKPNSYPNLFLGSDSNLDPNIKGLKIRIQIHPLKIIFLCEI